MQRRGFPALFIVAAILLVYLPALGGGFIWDDDDYVTGNLTLRSLEGLRQIWFKVGAVPQYYPLVHTLYWIEYHLWGLDPLGYHLINILLHAAAALLLWRVLLRLALPGAWLAALIFALHPVQVESVAWITECKNVLSAVFYFAAALAYLRFAGPDQTAPGDRRCWRWYAAALVLFMAALLSKTVTCSLPAALLLVCWWKQGRLSRRDVVPLLPFFVLGAALGLLTGWVEKHVVGAQGPEFALSFLDRCLIAGRALWFYAGKLLWPAQLTFIYPRWSIAVTAWWQWLFPAAALGAGIALWLGRHRLGRGPVVAALFFAGTLGPALGFINVYPMRYSFVADHFQYLASVGLLVLAAAGLAMALGVFKRGRPMLEPVFCLTLLAVLGVLTWRQCGMYANVETLWRTTVARNPDSFLAQNNLGGILLHKGQVDEAAAHFRKALQSRPDYHMAHNNLAAILLREGRLDEAIVHFQMALEQKEQLDKAIAYLQPYPGNHVEKISVPTGAGVRTAALAHYRMYWGWTHDNLGVALLRKGQVDQAIDHFQMAVKIDPDNADALLNLGDAMFGRGQYDEAIKYYHLALKLVPDSARGHTPLAQALVLEGKTDEAAEQFQQAILLQPANAAAHLGLATLLDNTGRSAEAIDQYRETLRLDPESVAALNNLAWLLATSPEANLRDGAEAVRLAERACDLTQHQQALLVGTLAAAYAEAGRYADATKAADEARQLARAAGLDALAERNAQLRELYRAGKAFHQFTQPGR